MKDRWSSKEDEGQKEAVSTVRDGDPVKVKRRKTEDAGGDGVGDILSVAQKRERFGGGSSKVTADQALQAPLSHQLQPPCAFAALHA